ncbi:MAG: Ig-like domain-containing protein, partial [Pseudomonadota bacterium]
MKHRYSISEFVEIYDLNEDDARALVQEFGEENISVQIAESGEIEVIHPDGSVFSILPDKSLFHLVEDDAIEPLDQLDGVEPAFYSHLNDPILTGEQGATGDRVITSSDRFFGFEYFGHVFAINVDEFHSFYLSPRITAGTGADISHLQGLPDEGGAANYDARSEFYSGSPDGRGADQPRLPIFSVSIDEDTQFLGNVFADAFLPNGIGKIEIIQQPQIGTVIINMDGTFTYLSDPNVSGETSFTYSFTDPVLGTAQMITVPITVEAVADVPDVVGGSFTTDEDVAVTLSGLSGSLVDTDGSEALSFTLSGVPAGASFVSGTDLGGGVWAFTPAELAAGPVFTPPANEHGTFAMQLIATATEGANNDQASSAPALVEVVIEAEADTPVLE